MAPAPPHATVTLRAVARNDLADYLRWLNDPGVTEFLTFEPGSITREEMRGWVTRAAGEKCRRWAIEAAGRHIGLCTLAPESAGVVARVGLIIGDRAAWGKGYGTAALRALLKGGFEEPNLHRVFADALPANARALRCGRKGGLRVEGSQRQAVRLRGRWANLTRLALLRDEWQQQAPSSDMVEALGAALRRPQLPIPTTVRLRPITEAHLPALISWGWPAEGARGWVAYTSQPGYLARHWVIEAEARLIGDCSLMPSLYSSDEVGRQDLLPGGEQVAVLAITIHDASARGKGHGTAAVREIVRIGFSEMGLHRIYLDVSADNAPAIACYEKCGFQRELIQRESQRYDGTWHDTLRMALLREEW